MAKYRNQASFRLSKILASKRMEREDARDITEPFTKTPSIQCATNQGRYDESLECLPFHFAVWPGKSWWKTIQNQRLGLMSVAEVVLLRGLPLETALPSFFLLAPMIWAIVRSGCDEFRVASAPTALITRRGCVIFTIFVNGWFFAFRTTRPSFLPFASMLFTAIPWGGGWWLWALCPPALFRSHLA